MPRKQAKKKDVDLTVEERSEQFLQKHEERMRRVDEEIKAARKGRNRTAT